MTDIGPTGYNLIYQRIPVRAGNWDRSLPGQVQIDLVEHCGQSASGLYGSSVSCCDIATGWWVREVHKPHLVETLPQLSTQGGFQRKIYAIGITTYCDIATSARKCEEMLR